MTRETPADMRIPFNKSPYTAQQDGCTFREYAWRQITINTACRRIEQNNGLEFGSVTPEQVEYYTHSLGYYGGDDSAEADINKYSLQHGSHGVLFE